MTSSPATISEVVTRFITVHLELLPVDTELPSREEGVYSSRAQAKEFEHAQYVAYRTGRLNDDNLFRVCLLVCQLQSKYRGSRDPLQPAATYAWTLNCLLGVRLDSGLRATYSMADPAIDKFL